MTDSYDDIVSLCYTFSSLEGFNIIVALDVYMNIVIVCGFIMPISFMQHNFIKINVILTFSLQSIFTYYEENMSYFTHQFPFC